MNSMPIIAMLCASGVPSAPGQVHLATRPFPLSQVRLLEGPFREALERDRNYLLSLSNDRLLHNFRVNAGLPSTAEPLGGWETPSCELRGHFTGHTLSACAQMYAATGDQQLKAKAEQLVTGLAKCQAALGRSGYLSAYPETFIDRVETGKRVWAPWYTLHKIMAGLLDVFTLCDDKQALDVLTRMAGWVKTRTGRLDDHQMQEMLKVEHGGMVEVLCNLYALTGNLDHLSLARRFDHETFLGPLANQRDELKGLHANTNIPKAIGAARAYELTGENRYREAASYFWQQVVHARSYCTGGTSNYEFWRDDPYRLADQLSAETHENCCTYNMLKLTEHVLSWTGDAKVVDYVERALFNGILPTQHPENGGAILYYVPLHSGLFKMFGVPDSTFACCNGTGIESFAKLGNSIYVHDDEGVFVNLFIASEVRWPEKGASLHQVTAFPEQESTTIVLHTQKPLVMPLRLRIPSWAIHGATVKINGAPVEVTTKPSSYLTLQRTWQDGDWVELALPMNLHLSQMPDDSTLAAVMYGPLVLAGTLGTEGMSPDMISGLGRPDGERMIRYGAAAVPPCLVGDEKNLETWIRPVAGKALTFHTVNAGKPAEVTLIPFFRLFGQRYAIYWNILTEREWKARESSRAPFPAAVVDAVTVGDRRSDRDHNFQAYVSHKGERMADGKIRHWVKSNLWLRYDLNVLPGYPMILKCTYWGGERDCTFEILIDGLPCASQTLDGGRPGEFLDVRYPIPEILVRGKQRVAVMLRAKSGSTTGELYDCTMLNGTD